MKKLIKDIIFASIFAGLAILICKNDGSMNPATIPTIAMMAAGIPCGWSLASKVVTAITFEGVLLKLLGALLLGAIALPLVLVLDLINAIIEICASRKAAAAC